MFSQATYSVDEDDGPVTPVVVLTRLPSTEITVQVTSIDGTATGEYCSILINYMINILQEVWIIYLDHTLSLFLLM